MKPTTQPAAGAASPLIEAAGVTKSFGGVKAVSGVDLIVNPREVVGIMGPNGAGKSTFLSLLAGAQRPTSGTLTVAGRAMRKVDRAAMARLGVGLAHQIPKPFKRLSVRDNIRVAAQTAPRAHREGIVEKALEQSGMTAKAHVEARDLGLLEMKRLELARVLALDPNLVLLDEVAAGLNSRDLDELIALVATIRDEGRTLVIVEHVQEVFHQLAERVVVLEWGEKLMEGTPAEVSVDPRVVEIYLGDGAVTRPVGQARRESTADETPALSVEGLSAGYGPALVLHDVDLDVQRGEILTVLGANGAGKSTLAKSLSGLIRSRSRSIQLEGTPIDRLRSFERVRNGIALVPEGRRLFPELTVTENLRLGLLDPRAEEGLERVYSLFPKLKEIGDRPANALSGGEQQMVAIGRAVATQPKVIIFDELSLGLAPVVVDRLLEAVRELADWGTAVILIEQSVHRALALADRALVLRQGRVVFRGSPDDFSEEDMRQAYLGAETTETDQEPDGPMTKESQQ